MRLQLSWHRGLPPQPRKVKPDYPRPSAMVAGDGRASILFVDTVIWRLAMARNPIQFQAGLSLPAFLEQYGSEDQYRRAIFDLRWPQGFCCPECTNKTACLLSRGTYQYHRCQCHRCHHQCSLTAGTIFHATKLALRTWFLAIYLLTQRKKSLSALQLGRELGVS